MGTDIFTWVEVQKNGEWHFYEEYSELERDYTLSGIFFDVIYTPILPPLFARRGIPKDIASKTLETIGEDINYLWGWSYFTYSELQQKNLDLLPNPQDVSIREYQPVSNTCLKWVGVITSTEAKQLFTLEEIEAINDGKYIKKNNKIYMKILFSYRDYINMHQSWKQFFFEYLPKLASKYDNVRVIVAFES